MRKLLLAGLGLGVAYLGAASPALAGTGDKKWAQCVWQTAPVSASNWLNMKAPTRSDPLDSRSYTLGYRLAALCGTKAANPQRPNRDFVWKELADALFAARPTTTSPSDDQPLPPVRFCFNWLEGQATRTLYKIEVVREDGAEKTTVFEQYFADNQRLAPDMRPLLGRNDTVRAECSLISNTGKLVNA